MKLSPTRISKILRTHGFNALSLHTGFSEQSIHPTLVIDHQSYPGVEAHVVTAANSAFWMPKLTNNGDVILNYPHSVNIAERYLAWERLLETLIELSNSLHSYRTRISEGWVPSIIWAHHELDWYRDRSSSPYYEQPDTSTFIEYVDHSIRDHIVVLNEYGFPTLESCSGLPQDHPDREPYRPYIMLTERAYPNCIPHFFTLADIADWIPTYAPHNFDVYIRIHNSTPIEESWNRLINSAKLLHLLLRPYRESITSTPLDDRINLILNGILYLDTR
jgi:hypothetical protein